MSRDADRPPSGARTRVWFVAQWGPEGVRASPAAPSECFRTVRCGGLEEAQAVALAGATALGGGIPWSVGAKVAKILFPTEGVPSEVDRWLYMASGWVKV